MSCIAHLCLLFELEIAWSETLDGDNLLELEHGVGELAEITTTNDEDSGGLGVYLDSLEVVGEVARGLNCV